MSYLNFRTGSSRAVAFLVLNSILPPIPSKSWLGVSVLYTSIESRSSVGNPSNKTFLPPSGDGTNAPFMATAFKPPAIPLKVT